ncbi:hypothetical protein ACVBEF_14775 [Glaciimonas sp. GG7]
MPELFVLKEFGDKLSEVEGAGLTCGGFAVWVCAGVGLYADAGEIALAAVGECRQWNGAGAILRKS